MGRICVQALALSFQPRLLLRPQKEMMAVRMTVAVATTTVGEYSDGQEDGEGEDDVLHDHDDERDVDTGEEDMDVEDGQEGHFIHLQDQLTSIGSPNFERIRCEIGILGGAAGNVVERGDLEKLVEEAERQRGHQGGTPVSPTRPRTGHSLKADLPSPWEQAESRLLWLGKRAFEVDGEPRSLGAWRNASQGFEAATMKNSAIFALLALIGQGSSAKVNSMLLAASRNVTLQAFRALDKNRDGGITMDELEVGILDAAGAGLTCEYHMCTDGFRAKSGVKKLRGNTDAECCDETCLRDPCSATGFRQRPDAAQLLLSESKCCEKTCAGFDCPNGWKVRNDPEKIVDPSEDVCCYKTCELHICGDDTLTLRGRAAWNQGPYNEYRRYPQC
ncbi:hypothetical protein AK812_SmicGene24760 [Symbiodinium microadriaticum]|uniref:EF-hand domain-containing protein n=1 Tax=Symbiodinium microadriaticum TaxID=2951 RepID=A0A1Q9DDW3_SYMMI|nr:hypothetical protein AK812_SmicGene24760 [Symbiodinium microadriaticum]